MVATGYVVGDGGRVLAQIPAANAWGFSLCDEEREFPGGFGVAAEWELVDDARVTLADRARLRWAFEMAKEWTAVRDRLEADRQAIGL